MSARTRRPCHIDLWDDLSLAVGPLATVAVHTHASPAFVVGLDGDFALGMNGRWRRTSAVLIPAGTPHALECGPRQMAVVYPMAHPKLVRRELLDLGLEAAEAVRRAALTAQSGSSSAAETRAALAKALTAPSIEPGDRDALGLEALKSIDARVRRAHTIIRQRVEERTTVAEVAEEVGLSASRLMHLFQSELGIPVTKVRTWERLRSVVLQCADGESLTMASLASGFSDSSHLSREFKKMFGLSASAILHPRTAVRVVD